MKTPTIKQAAEFCGVTEQALHKWKRPQNINGVKFFSAYGKHNLFLGAMISAYLFSLDYQNEENPEPENNYEELKECFEKLQNCCKPELIAPLKDFIEAIEKFKKSIYK